MNKTENIQIGQLIKQNEILRSRLERIRSRLQTHMSEIGRQVNEITKALELKYTHYAVILKRTETGWECIGCINTNNPPEDMPEDFDLLLPIPNPESLPAWEGF